MTAPRIEIKPSVVAALKGQFFWCCTARYRCARVMERSGWGDTIHEAATAGMAHLAAHHTAQMPHMAHGDPDGPKVAQNHAVRVRNAYSAALDTAHNEGSRR